MVMGSQVMSVDSWTHSLTFSALWWLLSGHGSPQTLGGAAVHIQVCGCHSKYRIQDCSQYHDTGAVALQHALALTARRGGYSSTNELDSVFESVMRGLTMLSDNATSSMNQVGSVSEL